MTDMVTMYTKQEVRDGVWLIEILNVGEIARRQLFMAEEDLGRFLHTTMDTMRRKKDEREMKAENLKKEQIKKVLVTSVEQKPPVVKPEVLEQKKVEEEHEPKRPTLYTCKHCNKTYAYQKSWQEHEKTCKKGK